MTTAAAKDDDRFRPVRTPFRLLAGFIFLAGVFAIVGTAYMGYRGGIRLVPADFMVSLPGMLWFMRLSFHAAAHGDVPKNDHWPFATQRVANFYFMVVILYSVAMR